MNRSEKYYLAFMCVALLVVTFCLGCGASQLYDDTQLDSFIELTGALSVANTSSTPINPYALPIGIALAGISAMLEALRRKERSARKHAEHKLNFTGLLTPTVNDAPGET